jgi:hypothetical protein
MEDTRMAARAMEAMARQMTIMVGGPAASADSGQEAMEE